MPSGWRSICLNPTPTVPGASPWAATKASDTQGFVAEMREINVTPHVAQKRSGAALGD
jgi:hypothetical protein